MPCLLLSLITDAIRTRPDHQCEQTGACRRWQQERQSITPGQHTHPTIYVGCLSAGRGSALIPGAGGPGAGLEPEPLDPAALAAREAEAAAAAAALLQELEAEAAAKAAKAAKKNKKGEGPGG